jgi:hypothetical protein
MGLIKKVITFAIWEISWLIAYLVLSDPIDKVFQGINNSTSIGQVAQGYTNVSLVFNIAFVIALIAGFVYLIVAIHQREYEYEQY